MSDYDFNIGDEVITNDGRIGIITSICDCSQCSDRGFFEPYMVFEDGVLDCITIYDKKNNFHGFYKIGKYIFGNKKLDFVQKQINRLEKELAQYKKQRELLMTL